MVKKVLRTVTDDYHLKLEVVEVPSPLDDELEPDEVVIKVEAAPINPSDLNVMFSGKSDPPETITNGVSFKIKADLKDYYKSQLGRQIPLGGEGAGVVVKTGSSGEAKRMMGRVVSFLGFGSGSYGQYLKIKCRGLMLHNEGTSCEDAASSVVNPLTVACMIENVKQDGHKAIIHTAAASQLGQMMLRLCQKENIPLVNIVRKDEQEEILRLLGAKYIVRSDKASFEDDLIKTVVETKATVAFDATGGGDMTSILLKAMEHGARQYGAEFDPSSFYGTHVKKQVFIYGGLDPNPIVLNRDFGLMFAINGWLVLNFLRDQTEDKVKELYALVTDNIKTIFKTEYFKKISLSELVSVDVMEQYQQKKTGEKFLVLPFK